jgi:divalent metal cation (Fe/Co/Zn/Cd) transporter
LSIEFEDHLTAPEIEACVERIEARLKTEMPQITRLFVKPQTTGTWEQRRKVIESASDQPLD